MKILESITFADGRTFAVVINDICNEPVDAIVNAANSHLQNAGGVALAISSAAGLDYEEDCARYIKEHGIIPTGEAAVAGPGALAEKGIKGIINAVGPRWDSLAARTRGQTYAEDVEKTLERTIANMLARASEQGWTSVSYPAISSKIFGVPTEICARAYVTGMAAFFEADPDASPRALRLCNIDRSEPINTVLQEMVRLG